MTASAIPGPPAYTQEASQGPFLPPLRVVTLQTNDSDFIGKPAGLLPLPDGSFVVADLFSNTAIRFDSAGSLLRVYGRDDSERARLGSIGGAMFFTGDLLGIVDFWPRQIRLFDLNGGGARGFIPYEGSMGAGPVTAALGHHDGAWVAGIGVGTAGKGLAWIDRTALEAALRGAPSAIALNLVDVPAMYLRPGPLAGIYGTATLGTNPPNGLLVAFAADSTVLLVDSDGQVQGEIYIPERERTGVPDDFKRMMDPTEREFAEMFGAASEIMAVSADDAGFIHVAHLDPSWSNGMIGGKLYLSTVARDGSRACVDLGVQSSGVGPSVVALSGDRAFVVDQRSPVSEGARPESVLRIFELGMKNCAQSPPIHPLHLATPPLSG